MPFSANCPTCGAPVLFKSSASFHGVCEFCRSTLVRHGGNLENLGRMADLLEDASPIRLGTEGRYKGVHFAVVGRIQLKYASGVWNEWHLLFDDIQLALLQRVEQVVRLIRSKGVGVYFCSQNPDDIPDNVLGQLGNRIQHALRAYTPRDQKAVRTAAETFVQNPKIDVAKVISELAVGEALVEEGWAAGAAGSSGRNCRAARGRAGSRPRARA